MKHNHAIRFREAYEWSFSFCSRSNLLSHSLTSTLNCCRAPIDTCLTSASNSSCSREVERCLQADIHAVWATFPYREKRKGKGDKKKCEVHIWGIFHIQYDPLQQVVKLWSIDIYLNSVCMFLPWFLFLSNISCDTPFFQSIGRVCCILVSNGVSMSTHTRNTTVIVFTTKQVHAYMQS